jgi:hypothetical protein
MKRYKILMGDTILDTEKNCQFIKGHDNKYGRAYDAWLAAGNTPDTDVSCLEDKKRTKVQEYINEGVKRIKGHVLEWDSEKQIRHIASIWNTMSNQNAAQVSAKDIYDYVMNTAIPAVNGISTGNISVDVATVEAIDVVNDPNFPSRDIPQDYDSPDEVVYPTKPK